MTIELGATFSGRDDQFHDIGDRWWATETAWYSFSVPERQLGGWLYTLVRPNIGTVQGGAWIWDSTAHEPWEFPYYANYSAAKLEPGTDLTRASLKTGVRITALEPLTKYRLQYHDEGRLELDLEFEAIMEPFPYAAGKPPFLDASHFDQTGRITGEFTLHGERIAVDCLSVRDRSWGPRPESRPRRLSYCFGTANETTGFFVTTEPAVEGDPVNHGYLLKDGRLGRVISGAREVERDPITDRIVVDRIAGTDEHGRAFAATGRPLSVGAINRHTAVTWNYLMEWDLDGVRAYGEDQDMWPVHDWSDFRRARHVARRTA